MTVIINKSIGFHNGSYNDRIEHKDRILTKTIDMPFVPEKGMQILFDDLRDEILSSCYSVYSKEWIVDLIPSSFNMANYKMADAQTSQFLYHGFVIKEQI